MYYVVYYLVHYATWILYDRLGRKNTILWYFIYMYTCGLNNKITPVNKQFLYLNIKLVLIICADLSYNKNYRKDCL